MLAGHLSSNFWRQSFMGVTFLTLPPTFIQLLSDHGIETIIVALATTVATYSSYHSFYVSSKPIIRLANLNKKFCITGICLLLINTIIAIFSYLIIIFIFQKLDDLGGLKWVQIGIAIDFGIFIGSSIKQTRRSEDNNLQQVNQILGGFDLFTFPFTGRLIHLILNILNQLQDDTTSKLDTQIRRQKSQLVRKITNILDEFSLDNIEQYIKIEIEIDCHPKIDSHRNYQHELNQIRSLPVQQRRLRLSGLIIDICDHDEIQNLLKNDLQSQIIQAIQQTNLD